MSTSKTQEYHYASVQNNTPKLTFHHFLVLNISFTVTVMT